MIFGRRLYFEANKGHLDLAREVLEGELGFSHSRDRGFSKYSQGSMGWSYKGSERSEALFFPDIIEQGASRDVVELRYVLEKGVADRDVFETDHLAKAARHLRERIPGEIIFENIEPDISIDDVLSKLGK